MILSKKLVIEKGGCSVKKNIWVIVIFLFFHLTFGASAADNDYWEGFFQRADFQMPNGHGKLELDLKPGEWDQGASVHNGLDTEFKGQVTLFNHLGLWGNVISYRDYLKMVGELQFRFIQTPTWSVAAMGRMYSIYKDFSTPSVRLLADTRLNEKMTLHNGIQLYFYDFDTNVIGKHFDTGLHYEMDQHHAFKARFKLFFTEWKDKIVDVRFAYRYTVNPQTRYYLYMYFDPDNVHMENVVEFTPIQPLKLTANLVVNTGEWKNDYESDEVNFVRHWASLKAEYSLTRSLVLSGEYKKEAALDGYSYLKIGLDWNL